MKQFNILKKAITFCIVMTSGLVFGQVTTTFDYTGSIETYTVPDGVTSIRIETRGAQGGGGLSGVVGGQGAIMIGTFDVTPGDELKILVGGEGIAGTDDGPQAGGSGGGGSFVATSADEPMIIAGGGGGAMGRAGLLVDGGAGQTGEAGQAGEGLGGAGGADGNGGDTWPWPGWHSGTGGGGFYTDGSADSNGNTAAFGTINGRGISFVSGGAGGIGGSLGRAGGFGGGGAAGFTGAGGGGYSGGGSGTHDAPAAHSGGGGGSYNEGTDQDNTAGANEGNGQIIITELCTPLSLTASEEEICLGEELTLTATGDGMISWEDGVEDGVAFTPAEAGTITYTAVSDDDMVCETTIEIVVNALPEVDATVDIAEVCPGGSVVFTAGGDAESYSWDMGVVDGDAFTPEATATYTLTGESAEGCENTDEIEVVVFDLPEVVANATATEICLGEEVVLTGSGAETYVWDAPIEDGVGYTPAEAGTETFMVTGTDVNGCVNTATVDITTYEQIEITIESTTDETLGSDGEIDITVTGGNPDYSFDWDNDGTGDFDDTEDLTGLTGGTYIVVIEDEGAVCTATETIVVNSQVGIVQETKTNLNVYPNPTVNDIEVLFEGNFNYALMSISGQVIVTGSGFNSEFISMSNYASGTYILRVTSENTIEDVKIIKK